MSSKLKMALTLTVIGLLSGASIWAVNELTAPVIADNQARAELAIFFEFFPEGISVDSVPIEDGILDTEYTVKDRSDRILGYVLRGVSEGYGGRMTVLVALNPSGEIVDVKVTLIVKRPIF
jgi:Na+-translocating ferredoxin:NAD+ oxidoreductase RnfG subunit